MLLAECGALGGGKRRSRARQIEQLIVHDRHCVTSKWRPSERGAIPEQLELQSSCRRCPKPPR
jgi:hypothetical protein